MSYETKNNTAPTHIKIRGATVIVIEHDLDVIRNADYVIDMGPGGGEAGGRIVAAGTSKQVAENEKSVTGRYIFYRNEGE